MGPLSRKRGAAMVTRIAAGIAVTMMLSAADFLTTAPIAEADPGGGFGYPLKVMRPTSTSPIVTLVDVNLYCRSITIGKP